MDQHLTRLRKTADQLDDLARLIENTFRVDVPAPPTALPELRLEEVRVLIAFMKGEAQLMASPTTPGNLFSCEGKDLTVNFSASSFEGSPHFSAKDDEQQIEFQLVRRGDVKVLQTPMGQLVTGTYFKRALADGPTYHYNLIIPQHEIAGFGTLKLETQVLRTTVFSAFRPHGVSIPLQHTETIPVTYEANSVVF